MKTANKSFTIQMSDTQLARFNAICDFYSNNKSFNTESAAIETLIERALRSVEHTIDHTEKAKTKNDAINTLLKAKSAEEIEAAIARLRSKKS
jgi:hypothetical protein